ncbi:hypothetical protein [Oceanibacterium hippocampi]|uniref:Bacterial membrane protein YfhO n=1 Tax=Oceanibacterium hippocampi TaxID=745714 RepID=A0A1Y5S145_9PROT|nr:hypothetical protein [Oceanibacterium hippocampi]SLN29680.1 hypothetical protein OCH7691_01023 [Oceanibacterium hippocampi]
MRAHETVFLPAVDANRAGVIRGAWLNGFAELALPLAFAVAMILQRLGMLDILRIRAGYSPVDYVTFRLCPECYARDWPHPAMLYDKSLPMNLHVWLEQAGLVSAEQFLPFYVVLQALVLVGGTWILARSLFPSRLHAVAGLAVVTFGHVAGANLAGFGDGLAHFSPYLYYNFAHGFALAGLGFVLRRMPLAAALALAVAILSHVMIGLYAALFAATFLAVAPVRTWLTARHAAGALIVAAAALWMIVPELGAPAGDPIGSGEWYRRMLLYTAHLSPVETGLFTTRLGPVVLPVLLPVMLAVLIALGRWSGSVTERFVLAGCLALSALTVIGLALPSFTHEPFLLRLTLARASYLVTVIAVLLVAAWLADRLCRGSVLLAVPAAFALLVLPLTQPGIAVVPCLAVLLLDSLLDPDSPRAARRWFVAAVALLLLVAALVAWYSGIRPAGLDLMTGALKGTIGGIVPLLLLKIAVVVAVIAQGLRLLARYWPVAGNVAPGAVVLTLLVVLIGVGWWSADLRASRQIARHGASVADSMAAQRWLADHTPRDSLFIAPPDGMNGWRELSARSFFGMPRHLMQGYSIYRSDKAVLAEGDRRLAVFGFDVREIPLAEIAARVRVDPTYYLRAVNDAARRAYDGMTAEGFARLRREYGVDYAVVHAGRCPDCAGRLPRCHAGPVYEVYGLGGRCGDD